MTKMKATAFSTLAIAISVVGSAASKGGESVRWTKSYAEARAEASRTGRPIVLIVGSRDCPWCRKLEQTTLRDRRVVRKLNGETVSLKVDSDDESQAELLASLRVRSLPSTMVIAEDGTILARRSGYLESASFLKLVQTAISIKR